MTDPSAWGKPLPLTLRQLEALQVVYELIDVLGMLPTYKQIGIELGTDSKGSVARVLYRLRDGGWIKLDRRRGADCIVVLVPPPVMPDDDMSIELLPAGAAYIEAVAEPGENGS